MDGLRQEPSGWWHEARHWWVGAAQYPNHDGMRRVVGSPLRQSKARHRTPTAMVLGTAQDTLSYGARRGTGPHDEAWSGTGPPWWSTARHRTPTTTKQGAAKDTTGKKGDAAQNPTGKGDAAQDPTGKKREAAQDPTAKKRDAAQDSHRDGAWPTKTARCVTEPPSRLNEAHQSLHCNNLGHLPWRHTTYAQDSTNDNRFPGLG